jgi:hypothetical protein
MNVRVKVVLPWVLFAVALIAAIVFGVLWLQATAEQQEADDVRATATDVALALTNFSAKTIDQDVAEIEQHAVGRFAEEVDVFFGKEAIAAIEEAEGASEGKIESVFVQEIEGEDASAFVVVSETVRNARLAEARTDTIRFDISMIQTPDGWKADNVDIIQSPGTVIPEGVGG